MAGHKNSYYLLRNDDVGYRDVTYRRRGRPEWEAPIWPRAGVAFHQISQDDLRDLLNEAFKRGYQEAQEDMRRSMGIDQ